MGEHLRNYCTVATAAKIIGVSASQVYRYIRAGGLPAIMLSDIHLIKREDAEALQRKPCGRKQYNADAVDEPYGVLQLATYLNVNRKTATRILREAVNRNARGVKLTDDGYRITLAARQKIRRDRQG